MTQQEIIQRLPKAFHRYKIKHTVKTGGKDNEFCVLIWELAKLVGTVEYVDYWNLTIDWLDNHHPGWRGYTIKYPWGQVA